MDSKQQDMEDFLKDYENSSELQKACSESDPQDVLYGFLYGTRLQNTNDTRLVFYDPVRQFTWRIRGGTGSGNHAEFSVCNIKELVPTIMEKQGAEGTTDLKVFLNQTPCGRTPNRDYGCGGILAKTVNKYQGKLKIEVVFSQLHQVNRNSKKENKNWNHKAGMDSMRYLHNCEWISIRPFEGYDWNELFSMLGINFGYPSVVEEAQMSGDQIYRLRLEEDTRNKQDFEYIKRELSLKADH